MAYRELSREQLLKQLEDIRKEKAASTQRVLELEAELKHKKNVNDIQVKSENGRTRVRVQATNGSTISNVRVNSTTELNMFMETKPWMKIGAWIILALVALPLMFVGIYAVVTNGFAAFVLFFGLVCVILGLGFSAYIHGRKSIF